MYVFNNRKQSEKTHKLLIAINSEERSKRNRRKRVLYILFKIILYCLIFLLKKTGFAS